MTTFSELAPLLALTDQLLAAFEAEDWPHAQTLQVQRDTSIRQIVTEAQSTLTPDQLASLIEQIQTIESMVADRAQHLKAQVQQQVSTASKQRQAISKYQQQK